LSKNRLLDPLIHVWLAGLGAVSMAHTDGSKLLKELIKEGARVQAYERDAAANLVHSTLGDVQALVRRVVNELPPYRVLEELRALRKQMDIVNANIEKLAIQRRVPPTRRVAQKPRKGL
jgi:hypothetical protein